MIDASRPGSPGWWLDRLAKRLLERRPRFQLLEDHFTGDALVPPMASRPTRQAYQNFCRLARTNYSELIVEAVRERMQPQAIRTGADSDDTGDAAAWEIWQANSLDADAALVHRASLTMGTAFVIVGGPERRLGGAPLITPEDPREVIVEHDLKLRREPIAALKLYRDDVAGVDRAVLFLPGLVYKASAGASQPGNPAFEAASWTWDNGEPERLPAPVVPVVAFPNKASLRGGFSGEFESHLGLLDRIGYEILQRLQIATMQAFRQRAVKGVPNKDAQGNDVDYSDVFALDPGSLWLLPAGAEMWESGQVDLGPIRSAIRDDVQDLAAVTRTPMHYLMPDSANGSAEGASLAREGLVFKTQDRLVQAGESWEAVMSLAFTFAGDEQRASRRDLEILWASPERFSLAERYDAASKAQAAGVPWSTVMSSVLQYSPQEIDRMAAERASDAFLSAITNPVTQPAAAPTPLPDINEA